MSPMIPEHIHLSHQISPDNAGLRLDKVLAMHFAQHSRARLQQWIEAGFVLVEGNQWRGSDKVKGNERVEIDAPIELCGSWEANHAHPNMPEIAIVYEDDSLIVIDKPAGWVTHPGAGTHVNTVANVLLSRYPELAYVPRAGIVHRLDKDTTGLMVIARTLAAQTDLVQQLAARTVCREYEAIVTGRMIAGGTVDAPIGRSVQNRLRMAVIGNGRSARTHYRVIQRFPAHTHLQLKLETGRTHQIRVHMMHIGYPIIGDPIYGGRFRLFKGASPELNAVLKGLKRQALHARRLTLTHPRTGQILSWESPLPLDIQTLLTALNMPSGDERPLASLAQLAPRAQLASLAQDNASTSP